MKQALNQFFVKNGSGKFKCDGCRSRLQNERILLCLPLVVGLIKKIGPGEVILDTAASPLGKLKTY